MNSREKILGNLPFHKSNEESNFMQINIGSPIDFNELMQSFKSNHTEYEELRAIDDIPKVIEKYFPSVNNIVNTINELSIEAVDLSTIANPKQLNNTHLAIIKAEFAVCENGALWIDLTNFKLKIIPFICENLVVIFDKSDIVSNMIEAYQRIENDSYDYGLFIAGPSKTADIEQTLVTGAQGARRMLVLMLNE